MILKLEVMPCQRLNENPRLPLVAKKIERDISRDNTMCMYDRFRSIVFTHWGTTF